MRCCSVCRPAPRWLKGIASSSKASSYYLKSLAEMRALFAELLEACDNTLAIAERCDVSFTEGNGTYMPRYRCPEAETEDSWLRHEVEAACSGAIPTEFPMLCVPRRTSRSA